jgi:hypothetical protein
MLNDIIKKILQYGYTTSETNGYDIPYGPINGGSYDYWGNMIEEMLNCGIIIVLTRI